MRNPNQPFQLQSLTADKPWLADDCYTGVLKRARIELAELKGYCAAIPNPMLLLSPAIIKESLASSAIENIHTTVESILRSQVLQEERQVGPDKEVLRYREAIMWGFEHLQTVGLGTKLSIGIVEQLTFGRYNNVRSMPNAIVNGFGEVIYTPPAANELPDLLSNWERFVNNPEVGVDPLVKAAAAHYQFEAIHPFGDGNGRTGRIMMVLQLIDTGVLSLPVLYISGYINDNKTQYYQLLRGVTEQGAWEPFIHFMLQGMEQQARLTKNILVGMVQLLREAKEVLKRNYADLYSAELAETLFMAPIISSAALATRMGIHRVTASRHLNTLHQGGFLGRVTYGRNHFFVFQPLVDLMRSS